MSTTKLAAIFIVWMAFAVIMTSATSPISQVDGDAAVWVTLVLAIAAAASTMTIALAGEGFASKEAKADKAKRARSRVGTMVASLSDDEIAELRARLMAEDGELMPLESLLPGREERGGKLSR